MREIYAISTNITYFGKSPKWQKIAKLYPFVAIIAKYFLFRCVKANSLLDIHRKICQSHATQPFIT